MQNHIIEKLNIINADFYNKVAPSFDDSRQYYWKGWDKLYEGFIKSHSDWKNFSVLDIGCGNARFYEFLKEKGWNGAYTGIEPNKFLAQKAKEKVSGSAKIINETFENSLKLNEMAEKYNVIVAFGVLHHIAGFQNRIEFIENCLKLSSNRGIVAIAAWQFLSIKKYENSTIHPEEVRLLVDDLEENDYFLSWERGKSAIRYCHFFNEKEMDQIIKNSLNVEGNIFQQNKKTTFLADGKSGELNLYFVFTN